VTPAKLIDGIVTEREVLREFRGGKGAMKDVMVHYNSWLGIGFDQRGCGVRDRKQLADLGIARNRTVPAKWRIT